MPGETIHGGERETAGLVRTPYRSFKGEKAIIHHFSIARRLILQSFVFITPWILTGGERRALIAERHSGSDLQTAPWIQTNGPYGGVVNTIEMDPSNPNILYAFVDSLVSLQHRNGHVALSAEHRSAPGLSPLPLELIAAGQEDRAPSLRIATNQKDDPAAQVALEDRIIRFLSESQSACTADSIRAALQARKQRVLEALRALLATGAIRREGKHYISAKNRAAD